MPSAGTINLRALRLIRIFTGDFKRKLSPSTPAFNHPEGFEILK